MDQSKLRSLIYGNFRTAADMARQMDWGKQKLHRIVNGKQEPNLTDLSAMAQALGKSLMEMARIFLPCESHHGPNAANTHKEVSPYGHSSHHAGGSHAAL